MSTTTVTSQAELDAALEEFKDDYYATILIDSPRGVWLTVRAYGSATVRAYGSATVRAYGSATVRAYGSATVRAYGSATVEAYGSATVRAYDSATVEAYDSAMVWAYDSATVWAYGSATVEAYGSATVWAYGSAMVWAYGSATVWASDSATVWAYGSATVRAYGSATVWAYGSATVEAYGSATVRASDSATVWAYDSATVEASSYVAVHLFSARVEVSGGVVIDVAALDRTDWVAWASYYGVRVTMNTADDGGDELIVYKAVDDTLQSARGFAYPIGETVEDPKWEAGDFCGGGLHLSPRPVHARRYFESATRFLECAVAVSEVSIIEGNSQQTPKLKAKRVRVLREVNIDGQPVTVTEASER